MQFDKQALDRYITGNYGEDQFKWDEPDGDCGYEMRTGSCKMDPGHRGRHTTVAFYCDYCGKMRRGQPVAYARNPWDDEIEAQFCFMCQRGIK